MVRYDQGGAAVRNIGQPAGLDPEPVPVQRKRCGHQQGRVQVRVEAELVYLEVASQAAAGELGSERQPSSPTRRSRRRVRAHGCPAGRLLLAPALAPRLAQQLAVLLLSHSLAPLLND